MARKDNEASFGGLLYEEETLAFKIFANPV